MSELVRPAKRQRISKSMFLDLEAIASDASDEENEEMDSEFMTEDLPPDDNEGSHAQLLQSMTNADDEEGDEWEKLIERSTRNSGNANYDRLRQTEEPLRYQLKDTDMLWEIGCKVGWEEEVVFKVQDKAMHPTMPDVLAISILATSIPGRIYAEVNNFAQATKLARAISELNPSRIRPVPRDEFYRILHPPSTRYESQQWARIGGKRKKWCFYKGDTGLVEAIEGSQKLHLALAPRLAIGEFDQKLYRPPQALVQRLHLETIVGEEAVMDDIHGRYIWNEHLFSKEGFLLVDLDDIDIVPFVDAIPTTTELALFRSTPLLSPLAAYKTDHMIRRTRMKVGDRVKVITGEYIGIIGEIMEITEDLVKVYMPSQGIIEDMRKNNIRATYRVGDQVKVLSGEHKDLIAWVIAVAVDSLCVLHIDKQIEVDVLQADVEFHSPAHTIGLQPRDEYPKWGKLGEWNPNDIYVGKRVMVIRMNEMKGYKGVIKSTTVDGQAFVELDARLRQANLKVDLLDLSCLTDEDTPSLYSLTTRGSMLNNHPKPSSTPSSSVTLLPQESLGLTPAWDHSPDSLLTLSPAWDPSSQTPSHVVPPIRLPCWLDDPCLAGFRIKLKSCDPVVKSPVLEFMGMEDDKVKVRDMGEYRLLPFDSVTALLPTAKGELVIPKVGEMQGIFFKVRDIIGDQCIVRKPGTRPLKDEHDPSFLVSDLLQVFPGRINI